ncbi:MAG: hypothetical protein M3Y87_18880 [Myxococcota bacterium]|nr:hypothetical protein [Myxococcota bacterium]
MKRSLALVALITLPMAGCCFGGAGSNFTMSGPTVTIAPGFAPDPMLLSGVAGGPTDASSIDASCRGHLSIIPSHTLSVSSPMPMLRLMAHSDTDTTLVVRLSDGRVVCNDDGDGFDPIVDLTNVPAGQHNVFVGTYSSDATAPYQLGITTNPSLTPSTMTQPVVAPTLGGGGGAPAGTVLSTGTATVQIVSGNLPGVTQGTTCTYTQLAVDAAVSGFDCRWQVVCAGVTVYGEGDGGFNPCTDPSWPPGTQAADLATSGTDRDPSLVINAGGLMVRDDAQGPRGEYQITATMSPAMPIPPG